MQASSQELFNILQNLDAPTLSELAYEIIQWSRDTQSTVSPMLTSAFMQACTAGLVPYRGPQALCMRVMNA